MAKLKLLNTIFSKLGSLSKNDGQIVVTRDSKSLYIDLEGERIEITDWIDIDTEESLLAILSPLINKYYYTKDTNKIWRYINSEWECLNTSVNDLTPTYTESSTLVKLSSGEKLSVSFGKISKAITDLISHIGDSIKHITSTERTNWNAAKTHADSTHARTDATKVEKSSTNGNIKINGSETVVYTHPSGTNPHGTTKSDVGLGNVGNFKAVSTVASQGLTDTEKSNARTNIGAGTSSFSGSYNDLSNKPTIPTVGNGTVTIKQAGTSKGTFTMNQSGDTTIELTDNNTWRGIQNNLTSDSTTDSLSAAQGKVLKTLIDDIEVGGRNLILNSNFVNNRANWNDWGSPVTREIVTIGNKRWAHIKTSGAKFQGYQQDTGISLEPNTNYILTIKAKGAATNQKISIGIHFKNSTALVYQDWKSFDLSTTEQNLVWNFKTQNVSINRFNIMIGCNVDTVYDIYFTEVKLEKGNRPTDWSPAPEDYLPTSGGVLTGNITAPRLIGKSDSLYGQYIESVAYVANDTHILQLGYWNCTYHWDRATLLISSSFWGNQHGSADIIHISQDTNTNSATTVQCTLCRTKLHIKGTDREFYYKIDNTNKRIYLYAKVIGGNGYGKWSICPILFEGGTWTTEAKSNQPTTDLIAIRQLYASSSVDGSANSSNTLINNPVMNYGWNGVNYFNINGTAGNAAKVNDTPTTKWWHIMRFNHANSTGYYTDLAIPFNDVSLYYKRITSGSVQNNGWIKVLDSLNYNSYCLPLSGGTMTGQINKAGVGSSWVDGRTHSMVRMTSINEYSPFASIKTTNGSWEIGAYNQSNYYDNLIFTYITDSDYNASNNKPTSQIRFYNNGLIEGRARLIGSYTSTATERYRQGGLEIRENNSVGNTQSDIGYAPSIGFHWSSRCAGTLCLDKDAIFHFLKQDGTRATLDANINGNISGNATTATKLENYRTIFGLPFNGTSNLEGKAVVFGTYISDVTNRFQNSGIEVRENNRVADTQTDIGYAPSIGFNWAGMASGTLCLNKNGIFHFLKTEGTRATIDANINGNLNGSANALANRYTNSSRPTTADANHVENGGVRHFKATSSMTTSKPAGDGHILHFDWDSSQAYDSQFFISNNSGTIGTRAKNGSDNTWSGWRYAILSFSDSTYKKVGQLLMFGDSNNALITGDKGNFIWAVSSWSDRKLKKNIKDADISALDKINQIQFKEFDFIDNKKFGKHQELGYIADELKEVFPECVVTVPQDKEKFGYEELDQVQDVGLIKYLAKSIQELSSIINEQNKKINTLQKEVDKLKRKN